MADYTQIINSDDPFVVNVYSNGEPINTSLTTNMVVDIGSNVSVSSSADPDKVSYNASGEITLTIGGVVSKGSYSVVITAFDASSTNGTIIVHPDLGSNLKLTCRA